MQPFVGCPRDLTYSSTCGTRVRTWAVFGGTRTCTWIFVVLVLEFQILFEYFGKMICPVDVRDANKSLDFLYFLKTYIYLNLKFHQFQLKYTSTFSPMLPYSSFQHAILESCGFPLHGEQSGKPSVMVSSSASDQLWCFDQAKEKKEN